MNFTAIDFETAQPSRWSICQVGIVGIVRVEGGAVVREVSLLVRPPDNHYWPRFSEIHGITAEHTENSPTFAEIWPNIETLIVDQTVVAHNSAFDFSCLSEALSHYGLATVLEVCNV